MNGQVTLDLPGPAGARPRASKQRPPGARPTRPASNRARAGANRREKPLVMPYPRAIERPVDDVLLLRAQRFGLHPIAARVMASRGLPSDVDVEAFLNPSLRNLDSPNRLADIGPAAHRLAAAVMGRERIGIQTDYDTDGLGAHAAFLTVLRDGFGHPPGLLDSFVGHRLNEGYGLTGRLAERILKAQHRPDVLITADNGSSDEPRIRLLKDACIDVIVTDHHLIPAEGPPPSAYACVNPQRSDCRYPDKAIAGGMVAWLVLAATRRILMDVEHPIVRPGVLGEVLDYVACSTVADCVSIASLNNRAVIERGLDLIEGQAKACWASLRPYLGEAEVDAETIAFQIAPRIHSRTRLDDPMAALKFLMADNVEEANRWALLLDEQNKERKAIQRDILEDALAAAEPRVQAGDFCLTLHLPQAHPGVQGICSSRLAETYGRPTLLFAPTRDNDRVLTGSARAIDAFHFRDALQAVDDAHPKLMKRFGGHRAAAGVSIAKDNFAVFAAALEEAAREQLKPSDLGPRVLTDGRLLSRDLCLETVDAIKRLAPFGRGFEAPRFRGRFGVRAVKPIGDGTHLRLLLQCDDRDVPAVWFNARRDASHAAPCAADDALNCVFTIDDNVYRGRRSLQLKIDTALASAG